MVDQPESFEPGPGGRPERAKRPKLTAEEKEERALEREFARIDTPDKPDAATKARVARAKAHSAAALAIVGPEAREREGRRLYAGFGEKKAALIQARQAMLDRPAYDAAAIGARFDRHRLRTDPHAERELKRAYAEAGEHYAEELTRLKREIDALSAEQIDVSHAYASTATHEAYEARWPEIEAAEAEARRRTDVETRAILEQWIAEGARLVTIATIPDPKRAEGLRPKPARTGTPHLPERPPRAPDPKPEPEEPIEEPPASAEEPQDGHVERRMEAPQRRRSRQRPRLSL